MSGLFIESPETDYHNFTQATMILLPDRPSSSSLTTIFKFFQLQDQLSDSLHSKHHLLISDLQTSSSDFRPRMSFTNFPAELLWQIMSHLEKAKDRSAFLRTSRQLYKKLLRETYIIGKSNLEIDTLYSATREGHLTALKVILDNAFTALSMGSRKRDTLIEWRPRGSAIHPGVNPNDLDLAPFFLTSSKPGKYDVLPVIPEYSSFVFEELHFLPLEACYKHVLRPPRHVDA
ncbi:hypothetical protein N7456_008707 [Penicillium angulare]|uniref:F-box domain-containing protein n=1 Tax=Penicillium angulare TaxID=116970 RepID=A0A9W9F3J9_9EURO|nr:hypothetical protein N7456_008707 [Penicillium angulare]